MSVARHHAEWLSLLEISGPFLSMPVLLQAFPQGLDARDTAQAGELRAAYEEWADNQGGLRPDPDIHAAWVRYVLQNTLDLEGLLVEGPAIPDAIRAVMSQHGEIIRPDLLLADPGDGTPCLLVQIYPSRQGLEKIVPDRPWKASPATRMMELLYAAEARLGLVTNGGQWMLVHARRGETTAFVSWYADLWLEEPLTLRAFHSLLESHRFFGVPDEETLPALLQASAQDQNELTDQLGYQVRQAVEILVQAIDRADQDRGRALLAGMDEGRLYEAALTVMMRLVFLLTAEERELLLLGDPLYDQHYAVSTLGAQLRDASDRLGEGVLERRFDAWSRLLALFRAVYGGVWHEDLRLPAYGGGLFDPDRHPFLEGRAPGTNWRDTPAQPLPINNRTVLYLLESLQILQVRVPGGGPAEARRISFRALDIEQIGHVYEGLLDHAAARAAEPTLGLRGTKHKEPEIPLSELQAQSAQGQAAMLKYLRDQTGRSASALRRALGADKGRGTKDKGRFRGPRSKAKGDTFSVSRLRAACGNDDELYNRVLPFAGLLREDVYGFPVVIPAGSVYVTSGATRRATGTHYTPRSLTEPIVQHTLEPLVYVGPAEGLPPDQWTLRPPAELLDLKICDMAMGSGAFLVQTCRYLSERLVNAWDDVMRKDVKRKDVAHITPEGKLATGDPGETIIPQDDEEKLALARRLVADRCLYGVDKNHLAVDMAKLSLWLITLDRGRPFGFLDHALRHGDSLIGASEDAFLRWAHEMGDSSMPLFDQENRQLLQQARAKRRQLQSFEVRDIRDAQHKARLLAQADETLARIRLGCDLLVGARLLDDLKPKAQDALLAMALLDYTAGQPFTDENALRALEAARQLPAFHWPFEFPEVFEGGGFSGFVGNPPFIGGQRIRGAMGADYLHYLKTRWDHTRGSADYSAYFFLRGFENLRNGGALGLIATNTIAQGKTRELGLDHISQQGGVIYHATNNQPWPGMAAVVVNIVHIAKGQMSPPYVLDDKAVQHISNLLDSRKVAGNPYRLAANANKSFQGSNVLGLGFTMSPEDAQAMIARNPHNAQVLFPYLVGKDLNSSPDQSPTRWVINFFDWPLEKAEQYPDCMAIVREKVKPEREKKRAKSQRKLWWRFERPRIKLYSTIASLHQVLVIAIVSKTVAFTFVPTDQVYAHRLAVFAFDDFAHFAILQSNFHYHWAWAYSSTLKQDLNYSPRDVFETFPFPQSPIPNPTPLRSGDYSLQSLTTIGETYHKHRRQIMLERQQGLTKTYNRFHDPDEAAADVARLRELHVQMDQAVTAAYGWTPSTGSGQGLDLEHGFHETPQGVRYTISQAARWEVLDRLLALNHERYEEEVREGLHEKKKKGKRGKRASRRKKQDDGQMSLF